VTLKSESHDRDMLWPNRLSGKRDGIGQTPWSYEHCRVRHAIKMR